MCSTNTPHIPNSRHQSNQGRTRTCCRHAFGSARTSLFVTKHVSRAIHAQHALRSLWARAEESSRAASTSRRGVAAILRTREAVMRASRSTAAHAQHTTTTRCSHAIGQHNKAKERARTLPPRARTAGCAHSCLTGPPAAWPGSQPRWLHTGIYAGASAR